MQPVVMVSWNKSRTLNKLIMIANFDFIPLYMGGKWRGSLKHYLLIFLLGIFSMHTLFAQERTINGQVSAEDGTPLGGGVGVGQGDLNEYLNGG